MGPTSNSHKCIAPYNNSIPWKFYKVRLSWHEASLFGVEEGEIEEGEVTVMKAVWRWNGKGKSQNVAPHGVFFLETESNKGDPSPHASCAHSLCARNAYPTTQGMWTLSAPTMFTTSLTHHALHLSHHSSLSFTVSCCFYRNLIKMKTKMVVGPHLNWNRIKIKIILNK